MEFNKETFKTFWPGGYQENFGSHYPYLIDIEMCLDKYKNSNYIALDIGCGNGYWTLQFLIPRFKRVIALDVLDTPELFKGIDTVQYEELGSSDYTCGTISEATVDFVRSFGLFCHLSNQVVDTYLKNIYRVMRPGACGLIMFANWPRFPQVFYDSKRRTV